VERLDELAANRAALVVKHLKARGIVHTGAQANYLARNLQRGYYRQYAQSWKRQAKQVVREAEGHQRAAQMAAKSATAVLPRRLWRLFMDHDEEGFFTALADDRVPEENKAAALQGIGRQMLYRMYVGLALPHRPSALPRTEGLLSLPHDVLQLSMTFLTDGELMAFGALSRVCLGAVHAAFAESAFARSEQLLQWAGPEAVIAACDCNVLPTLPDMAIPVLPCAVLLAHRDPTSVPDLQSFVEERIPAAHQSAALFGFLNQVCLAARHSDDPSDATLAAVRDYFDAVALVLPTPSPPPPCSTPSASAAVAEAAVARCPHTETVGRWARARRDADAADARHREAQAQRSRQQKIDASWTRRPVGPSAAALARFGPNVRVAALQAPTEPLPWDTQRDRDPMRSAAVKTQEDEEWRRVEKRHRAAQQKFRQLTQECEAALARTPCPLPDCDCRRPLS